MSGRHLTIGERNLCRSIFGDAIAYDQVRIFNKTWWPFQPRNITMAPDGNLWFHPRNDLFCDDFCDRDIELQGLFIHEMTHVWQHQCGIFLPLARHPFCRYDYRLTPGKALTQYGLEQQAEIVRHIFILQQGYPLKNGRNMQDFGEILPFTPVREKPASPQAKATSAATDF